MYLLSVHRRDIIPDNEKKHADISEGGCFKVVAVKKEDGDGPHRDTVYLWDILEEFYHWVWNFSKLTVKVFLS